MNLNKLFSGDKESLKIVFGLKLAFVFVLLYVVSITAWIGDDAQITFRQVWNFINGDGITFNFSERVQSFTHPLWFLLLSVFVYITGELYFTSLVISMTLSVTAVCVILFIEYNRYKSELYLFSPIYFLVFSFAFVDYMTSGLENALSYFLVALLFLLLFRNNYRNQLTIVYVLLSLLVLNRLDYMIIFAPLALMMVFYTKNLKNFVHIILPGTLILICWFAFAFVYFGSPLPNTFFAKLNAGYPSEEILERGRDYFLALRLDLVTPLIIVFGLVFSVLSMNKILISFSIGQVFYLIYIYNIGGDFMMGRFFSLLVFISVCQLSIALHDQKYFSFKTLNISILVILLLILPIGIVRSFPILTTTEYKQRGQVTQIFDERGFYYESMGLFSPNRNWPLVKSQSSLKPTEYELGCGFVGYLSVTDSSTHIIDVCGLTDPFLARIPAVQIKNWRIGHHLRKIPQEYGEYLIGNVSELPDKKLQGLLNDIRLLARSDLFSFARIKAIIRTNSNYYSDLDFSDYIDPIKWILPTRNKEVLILENWDEELEIEPWPYTRLFYYKEFNNNLVITANEPRFSNLIEVDVNVEHKYELYVNQKVVSVFYANYRDGTKIQKVRLNPPQLVRTVEIRAVGANYEELPIINTISSIKVHELRNNPNRFN